MQSSWPMANMYTCVSGIHIHNLMKICKLIFNFIGEYPVQRLDLVKYIYRIISTTEGKLNDACKSHQSTNLIFLIDFFL